MKKKKEEIISVFVLIMEAFSLFILSLAFFLEPFLFFPMVVIEKLIKKMNIIGKEF